MSANIGIEPAPSEDSIRRILHDLAPHTTSRLKNPPFLSLVALDLIFGAPYAAQERRSIRARNALSDLRFGPAKAETQDPFSLEIRENLEPSSLQRNRYNLPALTYY